MVRSGRTVCARVGVALTDMVAQKIGTYLLSAILGWERLQKYTICPEEPFRGHHRREKEA
jgi:hypothetical protein